MSPFAQTNNRIWTDSFVTGKHKLKLDGSWLYKEFKDFREGQCHIFNFGSTTVEGVESAYLWKLLKSMIIGPILMSIIITMPRL